MLNRIAAIAVALTTVGAPGIAAAASDAVDADMVAELAVDATDALLEEQALLGQIAAPGQPSPDLAAQLRAADDRGVVLLTEFLRLGVDLSPAAAVALDRLPPPGQGFPPESIVYDAAISEMRRIADTPEAVLPAAPDEGGPAIGLLTVAAVSLLVLGAAALGNALRRQESDEELAAMAWSDGLTGLANRRRFDHDLASHDRTAAAVSTIMIDVDHFKHVNDTFGHREGDEALRRVATVLAENVRHDDVVYRYGGEEFCVLLPGATYLDAITVGERIVDAARGITLPDGSHLTVSVGVAHGDSCSASESFQYADRALLMAKEAGRDRAVDAKPSGHDLELV